MDNTIEDQHLTGTVVRAVVLVLLVVVFVPAIIVTGDRLAVPSIALMVLGEIAVVVCTMTYWLVTVGAPAPWLARRLRLTPDRLLLGAAAVVTALGGLALLWFHSQLSLQHSPLGQFDLRAAATAGRLAGERGLMSNLNRYGQKAMLAIPVLLVGAAVVSGAFRSAVLMASTLTLTGIFLALLKTYPPPPLAALGQLQGYNTQWPSGHAAVQMSVAVGMILWWWGAGLPRPSIVAGIVTPIAVLVGYSRAFLGIHWLSEVLSGWVVALVAAAIVLGADRLITPRLHSKGPSRRWLVVVAAVAALAVSAFAVSSVHGLYRNMRGGLGGGPHDFHGAPPPDFVPGGFSPQNFNGLDDSARSAAPTQFASGDPTAVLDAMPHFSETLLGGHVQPVGLLVIATGDQIRAAITKAGWTDAAVSTPKNLLSSALVSPTLFDTRAPDLVVRKSASGGDTHVAQIWKVPAETAKGCSAWAITASLDEGTQWAWPALFPERRTGSAIDTERDVLAGRLAASGLENLGTYDFAGAVHGTAPGGSYVTDGKVAVLRAADCG
jgi:membrane-associated phospholipid phosphatase